MKKWTQEAWAEASGIYADIIGHPFILKLADGTLPTEQFKRYIAQDELYLGNYGRQMFAFAAMIEDESQKKMFTEFARAGMEGEKAMHELMIARFGIDISAMPSKITAAYNAHTEAAIQTGCKEIAFASLLPCIWIYNEVGKHLKTIATIEDNPYREWIDEYGNEEFSAAVDKVLSLINEYADSTDEIIRAEMTNQFREGVRFEYEFWNYAYIGE
ncbi:MAG: TenA family protein [Paludibacteraceae bacterium]|nr:TenA family protein [Paludibacteraceae bacterium]